MLRIAPRPMGRLIRVVGSMGDVTAFSFCQDKIITTGGEGGMVTTNRHDIWDKIWSYKDHGKSFDAVYHREHQPGFRWLHESFGTNWRMTEMQAAIGRVQLRKLPQWLTLRRRNAAVLTDGFSRIPGLRLTIPPKEIEHAYYKYYVFVEPEALKSDWSRDRIMTALMDEGIPCNSGSCSEIYLEKAFRDRGQGTGVGGQGSGKEVAGCEGIGRDIFDVHGASDAVGG